MTRRKHRNGTPLKVYLAAYPKRARKYRIAEMIYGRAKPKRAGKGRVKNPNLVITAVSKNPELFDDKPGGVLSRAEVLTNMIERTLEDVGQKLTTREKVTITGFLDNEFRAYLAAFNDAGLFDYTKKIDVFDFLSSLLVGLMFFAEHVSKVRNVGLLKYHLPKAGFPPRAIDLFEPTRKKIPQRLRKKIYNNLHPKTKGEFDVIIAGYKAMGYRI